MQKNTSRLYTGFSFITALALTVASVFALLKAKTFSNSAIPIKAEVIELNTEPVFQYKIEGAIFEKGLSGYRDTRRSFQDKSYSIGDTVTVYYNPENPSEIRDDLSPIPPAHSIFLVSSTFLSWLFAGFLFVWSVHRMRADRASELIPLAPIHYHLQTNRVRASLNVHQEMAWHKEVTPQQSNGRSLQI